MQALTECDLSDRLFRSLSHAGIVDENPTVRAPRVVGVWCLLSIHDSCTLWLMQQNQDIIRTLAARVEGGLAGLGRELVRRSGKKLTDHRAIWNWTVRGVPPGWRYWVADLASEHVEGFDREAYMRGDEQPSPKSRKRQSRKRATSKEAA